MATYSWLSKTQAIAALQQRLNAGSFWSSAELFFYITEALRVRNGLCYDWKQQFVFSASGCQWNNIGTMAGSPRLRTVTDTYLYQQMQYMLLEPPNGSTWNGTSQFSLQKLQYALQNKANEVIQAVACNMSNLPPIVGGVSQRRFYLPDTTLETRRVRYLTLMAQQVGDAANNSTVISLGSTTGVMQGLIVSGFGIAPGTVVSSISGTNITVTVPTTSALNAPLNFYQPITLTREDTQAFQDFTTNYLQEQGFPQSWAIVSQPPLAFDTNVSLLLPGQMDVIVLNSAPQFSPPTASLLGVPDDWSWGLMYGALADLLEEESESTDRQRGGYCRKRYEDYLKLFHDSNWLLDATVNNVPAETPALANKDWFLDSWEVIPNQIPSVVQDGIDFVAVAPNAPSSASLNLVQNAPILDPTGTYVQVSRDVWDSCLGYAHHLASFKEAGAEFAYTSPLLDSFFQDCQQANKRVATYGLYTDVLYEQGKQQDVISPR